MLSFGNKEFRNLQEQVQKNADDIRKFNYGGAVLAEFGIRVVGRVDEFTDLPDPEYFTEDDVGDAYAVGPEGVTPYDLYVLTRPFVEGDPLQWFNIGQFPAVGPQGPAGEDGDTGPQGIRGTNISGGSELPNISGHIAGDMFVMTTGANKGKVYQLNESRTIWTYIGDISVQGPQGIQGETGAQGPQGIQGIQGPQGDPGQSFTIIGQVVNTYNLPDPDTVPTSSAYLVGAAAPYHLYVLVLQPTRSWFDTGAFNDTDIVDLSGISGTMNNTDFSKLESSPAVLIKLDGEDIFRQNNVSSASYVYNMVDRYNVQKPTEKYIVVNRTSHEWRLFTETLLVESDLSNYATTTQLSNGLATKQPMLESSVNIKTINNQSLLGSGNISVVTDLSDYATISQLNTLTLNTETALAGKQATLVGSGTGQNIKTINNTNIMGTGNISIDTTGATWGNITGTLSSQTDLSNALTLKQDKLYSSGANQNIKSINNQSLLGTGNIDVQAVLVSGTNIKTINNNSILGSGNITISGGAWGSITGTLSSQTDLKNALDAKVNLAGSNMMDSTGEIVSYGQHYVFGALNSGIYSSYETSGTTYKAGIGEKALYVQKSSGNSADLYKIIANTGNISGDTYSLQLPKKSGVLATLDDVGTGTITDVTVGGTSVVSNGVAVIPALFSGNYNDLSNKPTLFSGDYDDLTDKPNLSVYALSSSLASVATSGSYADLSNKPTIPTKVSDLTNDSGFITSSALSGYATETYVNNAIAGLGTVFNIKGSVATISDLPASGNTEGDVYYVESVQAGYIWIEIDNTEQWEELGAPIDLSGYVQSSDLATVATTGDYSDLLNKPTIPTVPTNVSDFTNDAGYITSSALSGYALSNSLATVATSGSYSDLSNTPTIPTISANPSTTTATLTGLTLNGTAYAIQSGLPYTEILGYDVVSATVQFQGDTSVSLASNGSFYFVSTNARRQLKFDDFNTTSYSETVRGYTVALSDSSNSSYNGAGLKFVDNPDANKTYLEAINSDYIITNGALLKSSVNSSYGVYLPSSSLSANSVLATTADIPAISANPSTTTDTLTGITIDGTSYGIDGFLPLEGGTLTGAITISSLFPAINFVKTNGYTTHLNPHPDATADVAIVLPKADGTLALASDIPTVPTKVSELTNDSGYATRSYVNTAVSSKQNASSAYNTSNIVYSATEPSSPVTGMIWLKPAA